MGGGGTCRKRLPWDHCYLQLIDFKKSDIMSDKKKVTAREFQKRFGKLAKELPAGQTVQVTHHGKPVGIFTKITPARVKTPDFLANLRALDCDPELGDKILEEFHASFHRLG